MEESVIEIFTDGSCIRLGSKQNSVGAWVAIVMVGSEKIILKNIEKDTTHNRMELQAVLSSIDFLCSNHYSYAKIIIYSDSQYVVGLMDRKERLKKNNYLSSHGVPIQNKDLIMQFVEYIEKYPIEFIKVRAHQKQKDFINYNREADIIARKFVRSYVRNNI